MIDELDDIIMGAIEMKSPNVYEGDLVLKDQENSYSAIGTITYEWFPFPQTKIYCEIPGSVDFHDIFKELHVFINDQKCGIVKNVSISVYHQQNYIKAEGAIRFFEQGDSSIPVNKVLFSVVNLFDVHTKLGVKQNVEGGTKYSTRLLLEDNNWRIKIDKRFEHSNHYESLIRSGGYHTLYFGEISSISNKNITYKALDKLRSRLSYFLSFLGSSYVQPMFFKGFHNKEKKWESYCSNALKPYIPGQHWLHELDQNNLDELWSKFNSLYNSSKDRLILLKSIDWYLECNDLRETSNIDGLIILAQSNLELLYNWIIVEKKKLILGPDSSGISAANKLRLLLNELNFSNNIPPSSEYLSNLQKELKFKDSADLLVNLRNSIVHGHLEKRVFLSELPKEVFTEALNLLQSYIELVLLKVLDFNGLIQNRHFGNQSGMSELYIRPPWVNK